MWAMQKEIKDEYPKKGMPHAQKACKKKKSKGTINTQKRYATCPQGMSKRKKIRKKKKRKIVHIHGK